MRPLSLAVLIACLLWSRGTRSEEDVPESCEGLDNIGKARKLDCERSADCLSQTCNVTDVFIGYGATLLLFPCDQPPAFEILFNSPKGSNTVEKYDSSTPSRSTAVPLSEEPDGYELEITVFWATPRTAAITVEIVGPMYQTSLLDPTNVTLPVCKQTPVAPICQALQQIAVSADKTAVSCTTEEVENCDTLSCAIQLSDETIIIDNQFQVLSCTNDTPGIHMTVKKQSDDDITFDDLLTESKEICVFQLTLNITLEQLDGAIGLQVDLLEDGKRSDIFSYSVIPINRTQCTGANCCTLTYPTVECPPLDSPTDGSLTQTGKFYGDSATYTCNSGFTLNGKETLNCQANGTWDGDPPTCIKLTFQPVAYTVTEGENEFVELIIQVENPSSNVLILNVSLVPESAEAGADFDATSKVVTLAPGQREERVRVFIIDDSTAEETEIFTVSLSTGDTDSPAVATVTILDNDAIKSKGDETPSGIIIIVVVTIVLAVLLIAAIIIMAIIIAILRVRKRQKITLPSPEPIYEDLDYPYLSSVLDNKTNTVSARTEIPLQSQPHTNTNEAYGAFTRQQGIEQQENVAYCALANQQQSSGDQTEEQC